MWVGQRLHPLTILRDCPAASSLYYFKGSKPAPFWGKERNDHHNLFFNSSKTQAAAATKHCTRLPFSISHRLMKRFFRSPDRSVVHDVMYDVMMSCTMMSCTVVVNVMFCRLRPKLGRVGIKERRFKHLTNKFSWKNSDWGAIKLLYRIMDFVKKKKIGENINFSYF